MIDEREERMRLVEEEMAELHNLVAESSKRDERIMEIKQVKLTKFMEQDDVEAYVMRIM